MVVSSYYGPTHGGGTMTRALDCRHEAHDDVHLTADNDDELLAKVMQHRDEVHQDLSDDDIRGIVSSGAYSE